VALIGSWAGDHSGWIFDDVIAAFQNIFCPPVELKMDIPMIPDVLLFLYPFEME